MFRGPYAFLSNFHDAPVKLDGVTYPSVEHAYMAAKTTNPIQRMAIYSCKTPADAKRMGRKVTLRPDWDKVKLSVMEDLLRQKFQIPYLKMMLLHTGETPLVEENTWGDKYWGTCYGVGQNNLGRLLMKIRDELNRL